MFALFFHVPVIAREESSLVGFFSVLVPGTGILCVDNIVAVRLFVVLICKHHFYMYKIDFCVNLGHS